MQGDLGADTIFGIKTVETKPLIRRQGYRFALNPKPDHAAYLCASMGPQSVCMNLERLAQKQSLIWYHHARDIDVGDFFSTFFVRRTP